MKKRYRYLLLPGVLAAVLGTGYYALRDRPVSIDTFTTAGRLPAIHPDYVDTVVPPNIAPLNFVVDEPGTHYCVRIHAAQGERIEVSGANPEIEIPAGAWRKLLIANRGGELYLDVYVKAASGRWTRFDTITNRVAPDEIDGYLVYRLITLAAQYHEMGIYQRNLQNYDESVILRNHSFGGGCVNCHTFCYNDPGSMILHVRETPGPNRTPTLFLKDHHVENVNTRTSAEARAAGIISWHPDGRAVAFSTNMFKLYTHSSGFLREVFDFDPDLSVYRIDSSTVTTDPSISRPDRFETYPCFSPDGRHLYFCSAPKLPPERYKEVRCDLMRISYDARSDIWGKPEIVLSATETGLSITEPRISPDGRFLVCCMSQYGTFPPYQESSDLYLIELETGGYRPLDSNSDRSESWHSWSSNSRWIVFSSKRIDGLFARPHFSYIDENGRAHKPVLLPQKDPTFYDSLLKTYNLPELITGPVPVTGRELVRAIYSPDKIINAKLAPSTQPHAVPGVAEPQDEYR